MTLDERLTTYITLIDEAKRYSPHALAQQTGLSHRKVGKILYYGAHGGAFHEQIMQGYRKYTQLRREANQHSPLSIALETGYSDLYLQGKCRRIRKVLTNPSPGADIPEPLRTELLEYVKLRKEVKSAGFTALANRFGITVAQVRMIHISANTRCCPPEVVTEVREAMAKAVPARKLLKSTYALPLVAERTGHSIASIKDRLQILRKGLHNEVR